jgi:hypothetical protein
MVYALYKICSKTNKETSTDGMVINLYMVSNTDGILRGNNMMLIIGTVYPLKIDELHEPVSPYLQDCCNENVKVFKNLPAVTKDLLQAQ